MPYHRREHLTFCLRSLLLLAEKTQKNRSANGELVRGQRIIQKRRDEKNELSIMHDLCALTNTSPRKCAIVACIKKCSQSCLVFKLPHTVLKQLQQNPA